MSHHSILSPSGSSRWLNCPGSVALTLHIPDDGSDAADEGTDAHELAALCLTIGVPAITFLGRVMALGHVADEEMCAGVQMYIDYVESLPGGPRIERWVDLSAVTGEVGGGGTADHITL